MKTLKKVVAVMMSVMMLFGTFSIAFTSSAASKKVKKIKLNKTSVTMYTTQTYKLKATVSPSNASNKKVTWKSSDSKIAKVDSKGNVTALKKGKVTITCTAKDGSKKKATCKITVNKKVDVKSVKLNASAVKLVNGNSTTLKATVSPSNASIKAVSWSSSNTKVATVDSKGKVKAVGKGTATITCKTSDKGKKATCKVTVSPAKVTSITMAKTALVYPGKSVTLKVTVNPSNAENKSVKWTSSNSNIATVDSKGVVRGIKSGTVNITCTAQDGSKKSAVCKVTVGVPVTNVKITTTETSENAWYKGKTGKLTATVEPSNATEKTVTWKSSNTKLATVDSNGTVKIVGYNTSLFGSNKITITATAKNGVKAEYKFKIVKSKVNVTGVNFTTADNSNLWLVGQEYPLIANVVPENASNTGLIFTSSDTKIATVSSKGVLEAIAPGTVVITAKAADNQNISAKISIVISKPSLDLIVLNEREYYTVGESATVKYSASPAAIATRYGIKYETSDPSTAFITQTEGNNYASVKFLKAGNVRLRARTLENEVVGDWVEITVRDVRADKDFFENVRKDDVISINAYISDGTSKIEGDLLYTTPYNDYLSVSDDGKSVTVKQELPEGGAYIEAATVDGRARCNIYFIPGQYEIPSSTADRLTLMKELSSAMKSDSFSSSYSRQADFSNVKVDGSKSKTELLINNQSISDYLKVLGIFGISDEELTEGMSPEIFINEMFSEKLTENKAFISKDDCPDPITTDLSSVKGISVTDNGATYKIKLVLNPQSKLPLSSIKTSAYGKTMPVIDSVYLENYKKKFQEIDGATNGDDSLEVSGISLGTVNQTYSDGYVEYVVDKFTGKVTASEYHYKSNIDVTNAELKMEANIDMDQSVGSLTFGINIKATFSMDIENTLNLRDIIY